MNDRHTGHSRKWMKLDNAAKIYPVAMKGGWMSIFRLSAELNEKVDPEILQRALIRTAKRFPSFTQRLRRGFFWYYLEQIIAEPVISEDVMNPCARMNFKKNNGYMFRVRYHENRIALEVFHVLADGTGGLCFLKTLLAEYISLRYGENVPRSDTILDCNKTALKAEYEDSFLKYARKAALLPKEENAYHVSGTREENGFMHVTTAFISVKALSEKAKLYGATITEYLICHLIESIVEIQKSEIGKKHFLPVKVCVPVNMRKFYPSKTVRNFAQFVNVGISPRFGEYTFQETLSIVRHQMGLFATEKQLNARMSMNVNAERHKLMRIAPLFIKNPAILIAFIRNGDRNSSVTLSNLGIVSLPDEMKKHIEHFDFMLGALSTNPIVVGCISYNDLLCINITRSIKESFFEREFLTRLVKSGIHVKVESNQRF